MPPFECVHVVDNTRVLGANFIESAPGQDQKCDRYALVRGAELSVGLGSLVWSK